MQQRTSPDQPLIQQLFEIADRFCAHPDQKVSGPAIKGLRLLLIMTANWLGQLEAESEFDPAAADSSPSLAQAKALNRSAAEKVLEVLRIRHAQRQSERDAGNRIFTGADLEAIKLWMMCAGTLTPVPDRLKQTGYKAKTSIRRLDPAGPLDPTPTGLDSKSPTTKPKTRIATLPNGRRIQKQVRQRTTAATAR